MLCCVSRKSSARPATENHQKNRKKIESDCAGSSSGFSESSSASSGDFSSSGLSPTSSSSSNSSSGFSSGSSPFVFANSSTSGSDISNCFDLIDELNVATSSEKSCSLQDYQSVQPKRFLTFSPSVTVNKSPDGGTNFDSSLDDTDKSAKDEPPVLLPCAICARTFKPQSLEKHTRICERSAIKKRKPFDSAKQRIQGTDLAEFLPKETTKRKVHQEEKQPVAANPTKIASWKDTHDEFLRAIRAARGETTEPTGQRQVAASSHVTVGVPTRPNEKGMCPTCNRQFSIKAYERHVAWCKEHATRVPITPATNVAKERLEARMKYRAPPLMKNRRITNREKYSPGSAVNLSSYSSKNSQPRAKESVSTPNCNNKIGNDTTTGSSTNHQKATPNTRRTGQSREGLSSGPIKSRLSDRSSRIASEIGTTKNSSTSPISPKINALEPRFPFGRVTISSSNVTSPLSTSPRVSIPHSSRISPQDSSEKNSTKMANYRKAIELNISNLSTHKQNIVSARSCGNPKVNDVTINDQIIGMTVQRCGGIVNNDEKLIKDKLVTWKTIKRDKNFIKQPKYLKLNDGKNLEAKSQEIKISEPIGLVDNYKKSFFTPEPTKKLNQTYLISESMDSKNYSNSIFDKSEPRQIVNNQPPMEFNFTEETSFDNILSDLESPNWFNSRVNITSSPLKSCPKKDQGHWEVDEINVPVSPVLSGREKLPPLDLKIINNEEILEQAENFKSGGKSSTRACRNLLEMGITKLKPIGGCSLNCEDSLDFSHSPEASLPLMLPKKSGSAKSTASEKSLSINCQSSITQIISSNEDFRFDDENDEKQLNSSRSVDIVEKNIKSEDNFLHLLDTSRSVELISMNKKNSNCNRSLDLIFNNGEKMGDNNISRNMEKREDNVVEIMENNKLLNSSISEEFITKNIEDLNENLSSANVDNLGMKLICNNDNLSLEKNKKRRNDDGILETLENSRSVKSAASEIMIGEKLSPKHKSEGSVETDLDIEKLSINNSSDEKNNNDSSMHLIDSVNIEEKLSVKLSENKCMEIVENNASECIDKSSDKSMENIENFNAKIDVEKSLNSLEMKNVENTAIEPTKIYQRCGTYVIDRASDSKEITKNQSSDECLEEKPLLKRRRTEKNASNNNSKKKLLTTVNKCPGENTSRDLKLKKDRPFFSKISSNSLGKTERKIDPTKIEKIDRDVSEIYEKYVNENFQYDSDNNFLNDYVNEKPTKEEKEISSNDLSNYDSYPKAFSDSIVTRQTMPINFSPNSKKKSFANESIMKKFKKNMCLVRRSTDTLISSVETSERTIDESSSSKMFAACEIESTSQVEKETIEKIEFPTIGPIAPKTSYCNFLPKISVDRKLNVENNHKNELKCGPVYGFSDKTRRKSSVKLINLEPPKDDKKIIDNMGQSNIPNLPPIISPSFRKERRRSFDRDCRAVWSNYVRRRPDFNLVLNGRTGSCKDYDPFLLAERQMNELLSDTCSDQSLTDSLGNRRVSSSPPPSHNYPLSHSSAFVKYPDSVTRNHENSEKRVSLIAPPSEFDDLTGDFSSDSTETNSISREILADLEDSRKNNFSHENKSKDSRKDYIMGRRVIIDKSKALGTNEIIDDSNIKNSQTNHKVRKMFEKKLTPKVVDSSHVNRSNSLRVNSAPKAPERKNNNSSTTTVTKIINTRSSPGSRLNNRNNNNYASLSGSNVSLSSTISSEVDVKRSNSLFDGLASSFEDDASDIYPSLRSLLKNDSLSISSPVQSNRPRNGQISDEELSSPDGYLKQQDHNKLSADSAYSSLNRKYSNHGRSTNDVAARQPEDFPQHRRDGDTASISSGKFKLPKFCHECGCKFPETAKFCCECGIKRLALS